eukprot:636651-Pelagomonas_calceolata.AAC.1
MGKQRKNYVGRERERERERERALPASTKEKGTHWLRRALAPSTTNVQNRKDWWGSGGLLKHLATGSGSDM